VKPRVRRRGDHRHQITVLGFADLLAGLLPRLAGGDEHDFIEPELGGHLAGGHKVAVMDGIKRPAHHAQPQPALRILVVQCGGNA
jgi:hypothetical protein